MSLNVPVQAPSPKGSEIRLLEADVASGQLPGICVKTGEPTTAQWRNKWGSSPAWAFLGVFLGLIGVFVLLYLSTKRVKGAIPLSETRVKKVIMRRKWARYAAMGCVLSFVCFVVCLIAANGQRGTLEDVGLLAIAAFVILLIPAVALTMSVGWATGVYWRVVDDRQMGRVLVIKNAHPNFIQALHAWHAQRVAAAPVAYPPGPPPAPLPVQ